MEKLTSVENLHLLEEMTRIHSAVSFHMKYCISIRKECIQMTPEQFDFLFKNKSLVKIEDNLGYQLKKVHYNNVDFIALTDEPFNG